MAIPSSIEPFAAAARALTPADGATRRGWAQGLRANYEAWIKPVDAPGGVNPSLIFNWLSAHLPDDAILTNGAGNYAGAGASDMLAGSYEVVLPT